MLELTMLFAWMVAFVPIIFAMVMIFRFVKAVEKVEKIKIKYQASLEELEKFYGALSQRAFKGELDLSRVSEESAEVELETV